MNFSSSPPLPLNVPPLGRCLPFAQYTGYASSESPSTCREDRLLAVSSENPLSLCLARNSLGHGIEYRHRRRSALIRDASAADVILVERAVLLRIDREYPRRFAAMLLSPGLKSCAPQSRFQSARPAVRMGSQSSWSRSLAMRPASSRENSGFRRSRKYIGNGALFFTASSPRPTNSK